MVIESKPGQDGDNDKNGEAAPLLSTILNVSSTSPLQANSNLEDHRLQQRDRVASNDDMDPSANLVRIKTPIVEGAHLMIMK